MDDLLPYFSMLFAGLMLGYVAGFFVGRMFGHFDRDRAIRKANAARR